ncbi:MAG: DUF2958 domain-containing protein [Alphaproteobacteria bacterium]|nr:DUF2958 domain-containing protein [Alphaproteobacteria bacterium]
MENVMKFFTAEQYKTLVANGAANRDRKDKGLAELDLKPVVKLFTPDGACTWLISEIDPNDSVAFGLCDLGMQCPELGYISLEELSEVRGHLGLRIERDLFFDADKTLSEYADEARQKGYISA